MLEKSSLISVSTILKVNALNIVQMKNIPMSNSSSVFENIEMTAHLFSPINSITIKSSMSVGSNKSLLILYFWLRIRITTIYFSSDLRNFG